MLRSSLYLLAWQEPTKVEGRIDRNGFAVVKILRPGGTSTALEIVTDRVDVLEQLELVVGKLRRGLERGDGKAVAS